MSGFISLHRKVTEHWVFNRSDYFKAWVTMLMSVNHKANKVLIGSSLIECNRGQSLNSLNTWVEKFGDDWTKQKVRTFFKLLQDDSMINTENVSKTTRLTICNYDSYQNPQHGNNTQSNTELTRKQHASNTQATSNNKGNNENNDNKKRKETGFKKPSIKEISDYINEMNYSVNAEKFFHHYESKGWMIGKNKMKKWKSAVANWNSNNTNQQQKPIRRTINQEGATKEYNNYLLECKSRFKQPELNREDYIEFIGYELV